LVTRRCKLNLLEIEPGRVVVHFWGQQGRADLRPFFKQHGLATQGVKVALIDRKRETTTVQTGCDFLFGERLAPFWPWKAYWRKWQRRAAGEGGDWAGAPPKGAGFGLGGTEAKDNPRGAPEAARRQTPPLDSLTTRTRTPPVDLAPP